MPSLNFKSEFVSKIESGEKRQTIRSMRKRLIKPGDTLHLYTGMRTKDCRRLAVVRCNRIQNIKITWRGHGNPHINVDGWNLSIGLIDELAIADGFNYGHELINFFRDKIPFNGQVIKW